MRFAHPAEAEIARLLDFYGVAWQYEPTTFALVTGENGKSIQSFTPDFYLPEHDLYIEMTTMRQSLVTRKNRKFRLLRELYPELNVRLIYRKDVELILDRINGSFECSPPQRSHQLIIRDEHIQRRATEMAASLCDGRSPAVNVLALGEGAVRTQQLIANALLAAGQRIATGIISLDRFAPGSPPCSVRLVSDGRLDRAEEVVVVADIVSTGLTAQTALRWLRGQGAERVRLVSLLDRRSSRLVDVPLECAGFPVSSQWLVGGGLGGSPEFSELPDIHFLNPAPAA